eukprot:GHVU01227923.1.p1 GENE.GHVU01227923.1~~GHVU01227923.1.p1  ORF type:complete len:113 (+),score=6.22 GHVU01227923.1:88-426(+)
MYRCVQASMILYADLCDDVLSLSNCPMNVLISLYVHTPIVMTEAVVSGSLSTRLYDYHWLLLLEEKEEEEHFFYYLYTCACLSVSLGTGIGYDSRARLRRPRGGHSGGPGGL